MFATAHAPRVARGLARVASARVAGPRGFATAAADDTPGGIFRSSVANKSGLSHALDAVMREGHHDMRAFGRGTLAALASRGAYAKFTAAHFHFYSELERRLDDAARGPNPTPTGSVWRRFSEDLRRAPALERDLALLLDTTPGDHPVSPATAAYMRAIATAAEREESSCSRTGDGELRVDADATPALLAHFYARYLADLFGGSMLGWPTRRALGFATTPQFYVHDVFESEGSLKAERRSSSACTRPSTTPARRRPPPPRRRLWRRRAAPSPQTPPCSRRGGGSSLLLATAGGARVLGGYAAERIWGAREQRDLFGRLVKRRDPATGKFS
jgi:heme oxygenase